MSDRMFPLSLSKLITMVEAEWKTKQTLFGISKNSFFDPNNHTDLQSTRFGHLLESPLGVAAGPHTQLAQNIIVAWLCGARYIELKTVQIMDELHLSKPCIDMEDAGFNCEWSQELKLEESFEEYLKAYIIIHWLREKIPAVKLKSTTKTTKKDEFGTIFNMSVGYNLEGILSERVQAFIRKMRHSGDEIKRALSALKNELGEQYDLSTLPMGEVISDNMTLSTMHGCPADEIEKIGAYLIENMGLHTTIKLNPTLNGPTDLRSILNQKLGFKDIIVPDIAFEHDLKYPDAVEMIKRLRTLAEKKGVGFSLKLTNTLETVNNKTIYEPQNEMMYMSGRPLHAISINLAHKLQQEFGETLDMSFCAGVDAFNVAETLATGMTPVTVCSDLLKPGGYERLWQYFVNIKEYNKIHGVGKTLSLENYRNAVIVDPRYHRKNFEGENIKTSRPLPAFDCIAAPCQTTCPTGQDVPSYMYLTAGGDFKQALEVIRSQNPFPNTTGMACDHICQLKCTRMNYDSSLQIREIKRFVAMEEQQNQVSTPTIKVNNNSKQKKKIAIVGGGPSGLSAAYYLTLEGMDVEIFESQASLGGMVSFALPGFRTIADRVELDIKRILSLGVKAHTNSPVDSEDKMRHLIENFDYIYLAIGAPKSKKMGIPGENSCGVVGFLTFLKEVKLKLRTTLPSRVVVIGGGNSAIDTVRSAKRLLPPGGEVELIYRRTMGDMPALPEEIQDLVDEKISVRELTLPIRILSDENGKVASLQCIKMADKGRKIVEQVLGSEHLIPCDLVILAIGQEATTEVISKFVETGKQGWVQINADRKTSDAKIYAGGDLCHGPKSIIQGIADGKEAAGNILEKIVGVTPDWFIDSNCNGRNNKIEKKFSYDELRQKRRVRELAVDVPKLSTKERSKFEVVWQTLDKTSAMKEASRCLYCDELCDVCVTVCPNRANVSYMVTPKVFTGLRDITVSADGKISYSDAYDYGLSQAPQTYNIGDFCNECGNCATFCPTNGRPYMDKPKIYMTKESWLAESSLSKENCFFLDSEKEQKKLSLYWKGQYVEIGQNNNEEFVKISTSFCQLEIFMPSDKGNEVKVKSLIPIEGATGTLSFKQLISWILLQGK